MRRLIATLSLCALLAGCATTGGQTAAEDPVDKAKTGAAAGAAAGLATVAPLCFIPVLGWITCAGAAAAGAAAGGGLGFGVDILEKESGEKKAE